MATFGPQTVAAGDDAVQSGGTTTAGVIYCGKDGVSSHACWRWTSVNIPQGAIVSAATLHVRSRIAVTGTITNVHGIARAHKGDAAAWAEGTFEADVNFSPTTAGDDWDPSAWVQDTYYDIDCTTSVAEAIADGSWASGQDLAVVVFDDSSVDGNFVRFYQQNDGDTNANTITIVYTVSTTTPRKNTSTELVRPFNMTVSRGRM
jgi:hypothetical protein